jgi:hypothetical protein
MMRNLKVIAVTTVAATPPSVVAMAAPFTPRRGRRIQADTTAAVKHAISPQK